MPIRMAPTVMADRAGLLNDSPPPSVNALGRLIRAAIRASRYPCPVAGELPVAIADDALMRPARSEAKTVVAITTRRIASTPRASGPGATPKVRGRPKAWAV